MATRKGTKLVKANVEMAGLGDAIEVVTKATGIEKAVKLFSEITGIDCGCDERKAKLNQLFPFRNVNCLNEEDHKYLTDFFGVPQHEIPPIVQRDLTKIYKNVFGINLEQSSCSSCWRDYIGQLRKVFNEYGKDGQ
jgi:hypothetical protein